MVRAGNLGYKGRVPTPPRQWLLASVLVAALAGYAPEPARAQQGQAPAPGGRVTDLEALTEAAERGFPTIEAAGHAVEAARARLAEAKISPYFQLTATAGFAVVPGASGTPTFSPDSELPLNNRWGPAYRVGVEGAVPLYTFGKLAAARHAAEAGVTAAQASRDKTRAELRFDVRRAYFALQMSLDLQQMISEGRPKLETAVSKLEERLANDDPDVNMMDKWRLGTALAEVNARASEAERLEATARSALRILTGLPSIRVPPCPLEPVAYDVKPLGKYVAEAHASRPETRMLEAATEAREADLQRQRAGYFPDLGLALHAGYSKAPGITDQSNPFIQDPANRRSLGAALVARWSLDLWGNAKRVQRAEEQLAETRLQAHAAARGMELEVSKAYETLTDAQRREEAWQRGEREGRSWFVAAVQAYQVGTVEPKDLVDALKAYFSARYEHLQAVREYNEALAELERVSGQRLVARGGWEAGCGE